MQTSTRTYRRGTRRTRHNRARRLASAPAGSIIACAFPVTPGHEIAGWIDRIGRGVPTHLGIAEGDLVVVDGGWGDELCRQCRRGNQQICRHGHWAGFGPHGAYAEYPDGPLEACDPRPVARADARNAGAADRRRPHPVPGHQEARQGGVLGPGRVVAVFGIGGLGAYAVQYAKLLGAGATVVALARTDDKLDLAARNGADHTINTRGRSVDEVRQQLQRLTGRPELDGVIDCVGAEGTIQMGFGLLATEGAFVSVGLVGARIDIPLFPFVAREYSYHGSFWGNFNDLTEIALAERGPPPCVTRTSSTVSSGDGRTTSSDSTPSMCAPEYARVHRECIATKSVP
jgi:propanol-preferring alcohol dehydrogenase